MEDLKLSVKTLRRLTTTEVAKVAGGIGGGDNTNVISGLGCDPDMPSYYCTMLCTAFFCTPSPSPGPGPDPDPVPFTRFNVCSPGPINSPL